jgi:hypothetical protein
MIQSAGADHVQVVLDDEQRMAGVQQLAQRAHELGDVVEVQARGGLVEEEERALLRQRCCAGECWRASARKPASFRRCASPPRQRGHGLAQAQVVQADVARCGCSRATTSRSLAEAARRPRSR